MKFVDSAISLVVAGFEGSLAIDYYGLAVQKKMLGSYSASIQRCLPLFLNLRCLRLGERQLTDPPTLLQKGYIIHFLGGLGGALAFILGKMDAQACQRMAPLFKASIALLGAVTLFNDVKKKPNEKRGEKAALFGTIVLAALEAMGEKSSFLKPLRVALGIGTAAYSSSFYLRSAVMVWYPSKEDGTRPPQKKASQ